MLDPVTLSLAVSGATQAYGAIKKAIMFGKELDEISGEIGKWMTAVSDIDNINRNANNPSTFDKLFNGSVESLAMESFAAKKKVTKQREELKNFIIGNYGGPNAWEELLREEGRIRKARQEAIYAKEEQQKMIRDYSIIGIASLIGAAGLLWMMWIISIGIKE
tara:strand:+ start:11026 stop:11514 length:489 start_codon:yes stop_codon:yes gene_type:complete